MLIWTFALKVINNERKKLSHNEIINCISEQTPLMIIQVKKESKLGIHQNFYGGHVSHLLIHLNSLINVL